MVKYTQTKLDKEDIAFLQHTKVQIYIDGYKTISMSKLIKYAVKELETKDYNSIIKGMGAMKII